MDKREWEIDTLMRAIGSAYEREALAECWAPEQEHVRTALSAISTNLESQYTRHGVLGVGRSGIVIRLKNNLFPLTDLALKFPRPLPGKITVVAEMLRKEISHLSQLRHPNIVRILSYSILSDVSGY